MPTEQRGKGRVGIAPVPPREAIRFFEAKGYKLHPSFHWRDHWQQANALSFTVAKSTGFDILGDVHAAILEAQQQGLPFREFAKGLAPKLKAKGWWGKAKMVDPKTGEEVLAQLGSTRRLKIIFQTNLRTSAAVGKWSRIERTKKRRPYLRYVPSVSKNPRDAHRAFYNVVLPVDDPFWDTHTPPNSYQCKCSVQQLSDRDLTRFGYTKSHAPKLRKRSWTDKRTGETLKVPEGVHPAFAYPIGKRSLALHANRILADKLGRLPASVGSAAVAKSVKLLLPHLTRGFADLVDDVAKQLAARHVESRGERFVAGALTPSILKKLEQRGVHPASAVIEISDADLVHLLRDTKKARGEALSPAELSQLPQILDNPTAVLWEKQPGKHGKQSLLYVVPRGKNDVAKIVVEFDYEKKEGKKALSGKTVRKATTSNRVKSGRRMDPLTLHDKTRYEVLEGALVGRRGGTPPST